MALQQVVEQTVTGLGYELVEIERSAGGLLRITIDHPWQPGEERFVNVEDCEKVTRQLQFTLEVEGADYRRLEVSSPGIDRPLRNRTDFERFAGQLVDLTLKAPIGAAVASGGVHANRKKFRGTLERVAPVEADGEPGWQLLWTEEPPASKPGQRPGKKSAKAEPVQVLGFNLDEVRDARLAPIVNFKGRGGTASPD